MSINMNTAMRTAGLNATFNGHAARILPITAAVLNEFAAQDGQRTDKALAAGDVVVTYQDNGRRIGKTIDLLANNDLQIMIRMSNGQDTPVHFGNVENGVKSVTRMGIDDRIDRTSLEETNRRGQMAHDAAVTRGEAEGEYVPVQPRLAENAFANISILIDAIKARLGAEFNNPFIGNAGITEAALSQKVISNALRNALTGEERAKVEEARNIRGEISTLRENHRVERAETVDLSDTNQRMQAVISRLPVNKDAPSAVDRGASRGNTDMFELAFKPFTTGRVTPIARLGPKSANAVIQELRRFENTEFGDNAIAQCRVLLNDQSEGYTFNAKMFSRDGVDLLLVADQAGPALYAWDDRTRAQNFDPAPFLERMTLQDVPSDEELSALRAELQELRYDNGADIDFGMDEDPEVDEDPIMEV